MSLGKAPLAALSMLALAACSVSDGSDAPADDDVIVEPTAGTDPAPAPTATATTEPAVPAIAPCPDQPGFACSGDLTIGVENLAIALQQRNEYAARLTLVFRNRSEDPLRIIMARSNITANLDNGASMSENSLNQGAVSGLQVCRNDGTECFQVAPERFKSLQPGDSPARVNITITDAVENSLLASMPSITTGTITLDVYVVDINGVVKLEQISLPNAPVTNQVGG